MPVREESEKGTAIVASPDVPHRDDRVTAVMRRAEKVGLLRDKKGRIAGRISLDLVRQAKARTGIESDTELLAFALASVALEDAFPAAFERLAGTVDAAIDLDF